MDTPRDRAAIILIRSLIGRHDRFTRYAAALLVAAATGPIQANPCGAKSTELPNIIVVYCDNLGYGDIEPFGATHHRTPNLNRLAREGRKFTHFYSASGVCTPSRAALMTGCYPQRIGMSDPGGIVLFPVSPIGLHPREVTIAELLRDQGYATAIFGKWHLGDQLEFLPTRQGFDYYLGIPYSDDMTVRPERNWPELPLIENDHVVEAPVDRNLLTKRLNEAAVAWISENRSQPFFLYLAECMPGSTRAPFASPQFQGKSNNGPWGDAIEELDWSLGQILGALDRHGIADNTLVIWTSDNGAPRRDPPQGRNAPLGGWGYSTSEGGMRVPCIMRWPGKIPAGTVCDQLCSTMDLLPTFATLARTSQWAPTSVDGKTILPLMTDESNESPHDAFFYYHRGHLEAVRSGAWKLYVSYESHKRFREVLPDRPQLYNVQSDPGEQYDVFDEEPEIARQLFAHIEYARQELGDGDAVGSGCRSHGVCTAPTPRVSTREREQ